MGLFPDKKAALLEYIAPKMVHHLLEQLEYKGELMMEMQKALKKFEIMNFKDLIKPHNKTSEIDFDDTE